MSRRYRSHVSSTFQKPFSLSALQLLVVVVSLIVLGVSLLSKSDPFVVSWQIALPVKFERTTGSSRISSLRRQPRIDDELPSIRPRLAVGVNYSRNVGTTQSTTALQLANKLWDRLQIEEDEEPMWYLLNCVATNEIDLLRQCRQIFANMKQQDHPRQQQVETDVIKFVVPIEKKTRSHGANKMVTETKVMYPGYVFAKLRLCPLVYETIQELDLCRSWMGTVNHKGYKKLPPAPLALNEEEVENFGLEDILEDIDDDDNDTTATTIDAKGIIVDSSDDDDDDEEYNDPMYKNIDKKSLKQYKGLKVGDMVKVTQPGKFYNEDGIVRRLKDGQIFVRFYTYGTMFEEWIVPDMLRTLSAEEVLRGLSGSTEPITQKEFDERHGLSQPQQRYPANGSADRPMDVRSALLQSTTSPNGNNSGGDRNRRQDRIADRFKSTTGRNDEQQRNADTNWNWYKEQQQQTTRTQDSVVGVDRDWTIRSGSGENSNNSNRNNNNRWVESDVDSQWGRTPQQRPVARKDVRRSSTSSSINNSDTYRKNRQTESAIDGTADWSAFVSSPAPASSTGGGGGRSKDIAVDKTNDADDFFASLMSDLKKDLDPVPPRDNYRSQQPSPQQSNVRPRSEPTRRPEDTSDNANAADDFFVSLLSDLNNDGGSSPPTTTTTKVQQQGSDRGPVPQRQPSQPVTASSEDDFFASLLSDLNTSTGSPRTLPARQDDKSAIVSQQNLRPTMVEQQQNNNDNDYAIQQDDDFFASLEAELESSLSTDNIVKTSNVVNSNSKSDHVVVQIPSTNTATTKVVLEQTSPSQSVADLSKSTVPALKDMLRQRGLKVGGTKAELIERLSSA